MADRNWPDLDQILSEHESRFAADPVRYREDTSRHGGWPRIEERDLRAMAMRLAAETAELREALNEIAQGANYPAAVAAEVLARTDPFREAP